MKVLLGLLLFISSVSCSTPPATKAELLKFVQEVDKGRQRAFSSDDSLEAQAIELVTFSPPAEGKPSAMKSNLTPAELVFNNNRKYKIVPKEEHFAGGTVVYPFIPHRVYQIYTAPLKLTLISLEPGEELISPPASGDTASFEFATTTSIENKQTRQNVLIKPFEGGRKTTLFLSTNRRTYLFDLMSFEHTFMPRILFNYPLSDFQTKTSSNKNSNKALSLSADLDKLDFNYDIISPSIHKPTWAPRIVFTDGERTFIQFFSAYGASYAPVLFALDRKGKREIVNYVVEGEFYLVDRVLDHAELLLDKNDGQVITIKRKK